jgi:predicted membrane-bound mannosyltransferase
MARRVETVGAGDPHSATGLRPNWKDGVLFAAIVLSAFALRLTYVLQLRSSPLFDRPQMDERYHDQWAQAIATGETFVEGPYFRVPLYPAFLAAVYEVFGHDYLAPRIVQALLGALSCGLLFLIGRNVFGRAVGAVAGFAAASYWTLIYFDGELLIPSLIVFLDLLLIWSLLRAARAPAKLTYGLAGVVLGLSAIARPNILLFGPAVVIWLVVVRRRELKRGLLHVACVTSGCLLVILPVTIRNYVVGDDLVLIASQSGVNFYIGNNPRSDGHTAIVPGTPGDWWGSYYATIERAERALGRKLKASEVSRYYYGQA